MLNSILNSLLPREVVEVVQDEKVKGEPMMAVTTYLVNTIIEGLEYWSSGDLKKLDPNPGDSGCQKRGYLFSVFYPNATLMEEVGELLQKARYIKQTKGRWQKLKLTPPECFEGWFGKMTVSKELAFVLQGYVLAVLRRVINTTKEGVVETKTELGWLDKLSKNIIKKLDSSKSKKRDYNKNEKNPPNFDSKCNKIVWFLQKKFSASSVTLLIKEAKKITSFNTDFLITMLEGQLYSSEPRIPSKTFGCIFYEYKAILTRLKEKRAVVCFKSIEVDKKKTPPFYLWLQPKTAKGGFEVLPDASFSSFKPLQTCVVFEGVIRLQKNAFAQKISTLGFSEVILMCAAIEPPYQPQSTLNDVKNDKAREEIQKYRERGKVLENFLKLDHVYATTFKEEFRKKKK